MARAARKRNGGGGEMFSFSVDTSAFDAFADRLLAGLGVDQQERMLRALGLKFLAMVAPQTPVDTGRARAGWAAMADAEGMPLPIRGNREAIAKGRTEGSYDMLRGRNSATLRIRNAVPYIVPLEYGHSEQAPAGFTRVTLRQMRKEMTAAALGVYKKALAEANVSVRRSWREKA